jgi:succinate dehydrogenase / fumarate reductase iron-sulfur subunit
MTTKAAFKVWRSDDAGGHYCDYSVDVVPGMVVLDAIHQIQATQALMCMTRLKTLDALSPITVEPMRAFPLIKDLVTDVSWNFRVKKTIAPFTPRKADAPDGTWRMQQQDVDRVQEFRKCIECFLCQDVCHILRDHKMHDQFIGPRFLTYAAALEMHPLDVADREPALKDGHGIGYCNITRCCTKVCPEHITITENAIIPLKERVVDRFYDPLTRLLRVFRHG